MEQHSLTFRRTSNRLISRAAKIIIAGLLLLTAMPIYGQDSSAANTLTITQAITIALRNNFTLKQSMTQVKSSRYSLDQAGTAFLPSLSASLSGSRNYVPFRGGSATRISSEGGQSVSANLSADINLFNGFYDYANYRASQRTYSAQESSYTFAKQQLTFQTISQFLQVVQNLDFIRVAEENLASQQQQLDQIQAFFDQGNKSIADVLLQKANVAQAQLQLLTAQQTWETSRYTLLQTLGQPPTAPFEFRALDVENINSTLDTLAPVTDTQTVFQNRFDVRSQVLQMEAAREQIRAASSGFWPSLSLSAGIGSDYSSLDTQDPFHRQFSNNRSGTIGLSLSIPIFDRFVTLNNVRQAQQQLDNQRYVLKDLELTVNTQYQQALLDYRTAVRKRTSAYAEYQYTQQALDAVKAQYEVGAATIITLTQTRAQDLNAHYSLIAAEYNKLLQYLAVMYQTGRIDDGVTMLKRETGKRK